jgi:hypothetical protein
MIRKLWEDIKDRVNEPESRHRKAIRKLLAARRSRKLHKAILAGKAPRGRTI